MREEKIVRMRKKREEEERAGRCRRKVVWGGKQGEGKEEGLKKRKKTSRGRMKR